MSLNYFGDVYQSTLSRAPATDSSFITQIDSRVDGDTSFMGDWDLLIEDLDPITGVVVNSQSISANVQVNDELLRLTYSDGTFFQGVFENSNHAGFRVINGIGLPDEFASFIGSETSLSLDLLGDLRFDSPNAFSATWLTQSGAAGQQQQFVQRISASRSIPEPGSGLAIAALGILALRRTRTKQ